MYKRFSQVFILFSVLVLTTGSISMALPLQPDGTDELEYLGLLKEVIEQYYVEDIDGDVLMEGAYEGMFDQLDQYSHYFSPEDYERYMEGTGGTFGGVGITVTKDAESDYIKVIAPIEGTPGDRAGIKPNDLIIKVNGNDIKGYTLEEAVKIMRGEAGTKLHLTILREGLSDFIEVDIIREIIEVNPVTYEVRDDGIAYLRLKSFNDHSAEDVKKALEAIKVESGVKGIIVDLRNNPGGRLDQVVDIADMFLEKDAPIVKIDYRAYEDIEYSAQEGKFIDLPAVVLINEGSASASEILSGALQDNEIATIVGKTSFGKGTVQSVNDLTNGGGFKLTIAEYLTANGNKVNGVGITPDVVVENMVNTGERTNADFAPMIEDVDNQAGDKGLNIYGAQQRLNYLGYSVDVTGQMDDSTVEAINTFQESQKLEVTNLLDSKTRIALYNIIEQTDSTEVDEQLVEAVKLLAN